MKIFKVTKDKEQLTLEYDDKTSRYDAMLFVISEFGRYLQDQGREKELQQYLNALTYRNQTKKEWEEFKK